MMFNGLYATQANQNILKEQCSSIMQELLHNMLSSLDVSQTEAIQNIHDQDLHILEEDDDFRQHELATVFSSDGVLERAVSEAAPFSISTAVFGGANRFFVGPDAADHTLSRAALSAPAVGPVTFTPMVSPSSVNDADQDPSPLKDKAVALLTIAGDKKNPATVLAGDDHGKDFYLITKDDGSTLLKNLANIRDASNAEITKQIVQIAGTPGEQPFLFAAVSDSKSEMPTVQAWGDPNGVNRGIAVLNQVDDTGLNVNSTTKLDVTVDARVVGFTDANESEMQTALIGNRVAMYWDEHLQSLYIGLSNVRRDDVAHAGGVTSIVVGKFGDVPSLTFNPITKTLAVILFDQSDEGSSDILGFYRYTDQQNPFSASTFHLRVMHTSTGKDYLIMNGGVDTRDNQAEPSVLGTQVYAVPLVGQDDEVNKGFAGYDDGNGTIVLVSDDSNMPQSGRPATTVGQNPQLLSFDTTLSINDMQIVGDTVYVSVAGARDVAHTTESGIFSSSAIFDQNGIIRAWTPWKREMGRPWATYNFALDVQSSNFWLATTADGTPANPDPSQVLVTQWGLGDGTYHNNATLETLVNQTFGSLGGVYGLFNFEAGTRGFAEQDANAALINQSQRHQQFSMMVATGQNSVMLVETGMLTDGIFVPTVSYAAGTNVFSYTSQTSPALQQLGTITSAELSRLPLSDDNPNRGWLFVGGTLGLAVFADIFEGDGWQTSYANGKGGLKVLQAGNNPNAFPGSIVPGVSRFQFMQLMSKNQDGMLINVFKDVRKIISDQNKYLYVLTVDTLYRFEMKQSNFKQTMNHSLTAAIDDCTIVASIQDFATRDDIATDVPFNKTYDQFFDLLVVEYAPEVGTSLLLGTSKGLYVNTVETLPDGVIPNLTAIKWEAIKPSDNIDLGPTLQFDFVSRNTGNRLSVTDDGIFYANGNLRVLALDQTLKSLAYYRFDCNFDTNLAVTPFNEPYETPYFFKLGTLKSSAISAEFIGQRDFFVRIRDVLGVETGFASRVPILPNPDKFLSPYDFIDLGLVMSLPFVITPMVHDTASGSRYVAGEFGVRVNE